MALSTHSGGAAAKAGHFHEALWGVDAFLAVLNGEASAIRIETPGDDGAEFHLVRGVVREHWQAKRQPTNRDTWSICALRPVLQFFFEKFRAGDQCVFASVSGSPELKKLTENARAAQSYTEFQGHFLRCGRDAQFTDLRGYLGALDEEEVFRFLRAVTVRSAEEVTLELQLCRVLGATFGGPGQTTMAVLRDLYLLSTHEVLTAPDIEQHLRTRGITRRRAPSPDATNRILAVTRSYVAGQRARLIRGAAIRRAVADDLIARIQNNSAPLGILITSAAGGGKSACLCQIVEGLQAADVPVLAFRLDGVEPVTTAIALGEKLGLGDSPALVLADNYPKRTVALVVDQVDCVSATSGRHPDFFDAIAALRDEVLGLHSRARIYLLLACRKFDFVHDHRLKQLIAKDQSPIELSEFTADETKAVLANDGGDLSRLTPPQQAMLRLPQNLSLFIGAGLARTEERFTTAKELCDAYWDAKRRAVAAQSQEWDALWYRAIQHLATAMSDRQELSVPVTTMDAFPSEMLQRMASEGVLTWDGRRYGFGHETLFDYCFARTQPHGGREFVRFLESDAQHLFRRAQLRQVLAFLRDDDFAAYLDRIVHLLRSDLIRPHLKLLTIELVAAHPEPRDEELQALMPWIDSEMACRRARKPNPDRLASRVFDAFFASRTLFTIADRLGFLELWLQSDEAWLLDTMCRYLRQQADQHSERVAELLEPFATKGGEWKPRLRYMVEGRCLGKSRRLFDLFLRLLDDGTLDDAKDRLPSNGTFWSMLHGFSDERPAWCAELAAHWLDRRIAIAKSTMDQHGLTGALLDDEFGVDHLFTSARKAPAAFLEHILPAIIRAAEAFRTDDHGALSSDWVWPSRHLMRQHISMYEAFLSACEEAFELAGRQSPDALLPCIRQLRVARHRTANFLLMCAYLSSSPAGCADEVLGLLAAEPERLLCGYSDSWFWVSRQVLEKFSPHCSEPVFRAVEAEVLAFLTPHERTREGLPRRGISAFNLLSALASHRRSNVANAQIAGWRTKFGKPDGPPRGIQSYTVVSPIPQESAQHMTDEQWLGAIAKYSSADRQFDIEHLERGGAHELAGMLRNFVKEQPERFSRLALRFPEDVEPSYFMNVLYGLKESASPMPGKIEVARRVFAREDKACLCAALDLLGTMADARLPEDAIQFIRDAARHSDPNADLADGEQAYYGGDILHHGINTVRGVAALTIGNLIKHDLQYLADFCGTIDQLVTDPSLAVRAVVASTLFAVARNDTPLALQLMEALLDSDDRLLGTAYVVHFIQSGLREHFGHFAGTIDRMLGSSRDEVRKQGGTLACLARLYHKVADPLAEVALSGDEQCRLGACQIASRNLLHPECRSWCEPALVRLFADSSKAVRTHAATCFRRLWQSPDTPLRDFEALIRSFLDSPAFAEEPSLLLYALKETNRRVPEIILDVCEIFASRCAEGARDIRTSLAADEQIVGKLVFTAYAQLQSKPLYDRALALIDQLSLEGLPSASTHLADLER
ncbi:MAG: hypothetical protein KF833_17475 [Verrucomicrobiae bacterium]|nr:hypothetical protein [Verrucomicrobiae bacterium]